MRYLFYILKENKTIKANVVMVGGNFFANIGAYFYHLMMGRLLLPADYGALQSLISLSNIFTVPLLTLNAVVAKYISMYVGKNEPDKVTYFYYVMRKLCFQIFCIGGIIFLFFSRPILNFLHIDSWINFIFLDLVLFFGLLHTLNLATLQGLSQFIQMTIVSFIISYGKLLLGISAVYLGWRVPGAFGAFVLISVVSYVYTTLILRRYIGKKVSNTHIPVKAISLYALPSFLTTVSVISYFNTDVVLVRHFLSSTESGLYAALSVLGKIIFFGAAPIAVTMFPLVSEAHAKGESYKKILHTSVVFTFGIAGIVMLFYGLFPHMMLRILIGSQYLAASVYLVRFGLFLSLCTVINLLANYYLSIHETVPIYIVGVGAIVQALLLYFFHTDISTVLTVSLSITATVASLLGIYYVAKRK